MVPTWYPHGTHIYPACNHIYPACNLIYPSLFELIVKSEPKLSLPSFSPASKELLKALLQKKPTARIGRDFDEVNGHAYFEGSNPEIIPLTRSNLSPE